MKMWLVLLFLCIPAFGHAHDCEDGLSPHAALMRLAESALRNGHLSPDDLTRFIAGEIKDLKSIGKPLTTENLPTFHALIKSYNRLRTTADWARASGSLKNILESAQGQNERRDEARTKMAPILRPRLFATIRIPGPYDPDQGQLIYAADPSNANGVVAYLDRKNVIHIRDAKTKKVRRLSEFREAKNVFIDLEFGPHGHWHLHVLTGHRTLKHWIVEQGQPAALVSRIQLPARASLGALANWQRTDGVHLLMFYRSARITYSTLAVRRDGQRSKVGCNARDKDSVIYIGHSWFCIDDKFTVFQLKDLNWVPVFASPMRSQVSLINHAGEPWLGFIRRDKITVRPLHSSVEEYEIKLDKGYNVHSRMIQWLSEGPNLYSLHFQDGNFYQHHHHLANLITGESQKLNSKLATNFVSPVVLAGPEGRRLIVLSAESWIDFVSSDNKKLGSMDAINGYYTNWLGQGNGLAMVTMKRLSDSATDLEFRKVFTEVGE